MNKINKKVLVLAVVAILIAIMGCGFLSNNNVNNKPIPQPSLEQLTAIAISSATSIPALILTPSKTITTTVSTPTAAQTNTYTPTPLPTLSSEKAREKIRELFETNNNCKLPCWWGISVGVSAPQETLQFLQTLTTDSSINGLPTDPKMLAEFRFYVPDDMLYAKESFFTIRVSVKNNTLTRLYIYGFESSSYHLPSVFEAVGAPDEIWVSTAQDKAGRKVPFSVYLLYAEKGMLMSYGASGVVQGTQINGCVDVSPNLLIWIPEKKLSFAETELLIGADISQGQYKSILEATNGKMDVEQFYQKYKDVKDTPCFETSTNLWDPVR